MILFHHFQLKILVDNMKILFHRYILLILNNSLFALSFKTTKLFDFTNLRLKNKYSTKLKS